MENLAKPEVKFGDWIGEGWRMFTSQWKAWVVNALVFLLICGTPILVVTIGFYINIFMQISANPRSAQAIAPETIFIFYGLIFGVSFLTVFASAFFMAGMHKAALKQLRGGKVELRDLFSGGDVYFKMLGSIFLGTILTIIGFMLCFFPAYIVTGMLFFTAPLIVERKLGVVQAMQTSYELAKRNWLMFTLFAFVVQFIASAGTYACYIGILATLPLMFTITAVAYRDCFGMEGAQYFAPNAPAAPSNYGQSYPPAYQQPPSALYGQSPYEPPTAVPQNPQGNYPVAQPPINQPEAPKPFEPPPPVVYPSTASEPITEQPEVVSRPATPPQPPVVAPPPPPQRIICASCSASLPATASFCPRCGTRITT
ncbi:MAG: hypothetical protein AB1757_24875 [Acidobacteriota bacterium]